MAGRLSRELFTLYKTAADPRPVSPSMRRAILGGPLGSAVGLAGAREYRQQQAESDRQFLRSYAPNGKPVVPRRAVLFQGDRPLVRFNEPSETQVMGDLVARPYTPGVHPWTLQEHNRLRRKYNVGF